LGFSPDLVWIKSRSIGLYHFLTDTVRGNTKTLSSNTTDNEAFATETVINSFDSSGFTLNVDDGAGYYGWNQNGASQVAWCWDAGTTTVTNTQGSITSSVRANPSAGFSVITWAGNSTDNATIGHGLGVTPQFVITKRRDSSSYWLVYHTSLGKDKYIWLNDTSAAGTLANYWGSTGPTSSTIQLSQYQNNNGSMVAYAFAPVSGYSSMSSYVGNGSSDGPFVFTGMRPRWLLIKATSGTSAGSANWLIIDTARDTYNLSGYKLAPNLSDAENSANIGTSTQNTVDILSNGFKLRSTNASTNESGTTYVYFAVAENPFQYARAR
jgi:hypothetical protein